MKSLLPTICGVLIFSLCFGQTEKRNFSGLIQHDIKDLHFITPYAACDSIGWPLAQGLQVTYFGVENNQGFLAGNNSYADKAKGNFFDMTGSTANFITRVIIGLGPVNGAGGGNLNKVVNIKVLDGTTGTPGAVIGTYVSSLEELRSRRLNLTLLTFAAPVALPTSKKIFLILEFPTLTWTQTTDPLVNDSITLLTTGGTQPAVNLAWEQWSNNSWHTFEEGWGAKFICHLYPLVSATADGCTLPVTFGGFTGKLSNNTVDLKWQTWTETGNSKFEVERSTDAAKYTAIGVINSKAENGSHQGLLSYQFFDKDPLPGINFYRIRQVDKDGSSDYSKMIKITYNPQANNSILQSYYPNPAGDRLIIQLGSGIKSVETVRFSDASGRIINAQKPAVSPDGTINLSTSALKSGLNFGTIILQDGQKTTFKVIKQ